MANFEVSIGDLDEKYHDLIRGEDDYRASQFPAGSSRYKYFTAKITKEQKELAMCSSTLTRSRDIDASSIRIYPPSYCSSRTPMVP